MAMDINTALPVCADMKLVHQRLQVLQSLGLGYLTLGEETPSLSGEMCIRDREYLGEPEVPLTSP